MDPSSQVPAEVADDTDGIRWRSFAWWRTALVVVPVCARTAAALSLFGRPQDQMAEWPVLAWLYLTVPVLCLALPSAFIALYAYRRSRGAVYTALLHDAIILAIMSWATVGTVRSDPGFDHARVTYAALPLIGAGTAFGVEAAYLLRVALQWRFAWPALAVLVAGAVSVAIAMPPVIAARRLAHVRPLLQYANAHRFAVPPEAKITVGRLYAGARHIDTTSVLGKDTWWNVYATHDRTGRWIRVGRSSAPPSAIRGRQGRWVRTGRGTDPAGFPVKVGEAVLREVRTRDEARHLLTVCGIPDHALRFQTVVLNPGSKDIIAYRFWSPLARTSYEVYVQREVVLIWEQPLDLDQSGRWK